MTNLPRWAETDDPVELGLRCVSVATAALMSANNDGNDRFHEGMAALRAIGDLFLALRSLRVVREEGRRSDAQMEELGNS